MRRTTAPAKRDSLLDPYVPTIRQLLDDTPEMRATAVLERLRPLGYSGGLTIVRDRLRRLRTRRDPEAFLTLDFPPASAIQVDWADFGYALRNREPARLRSRQSRQRARTGPLLYSWRCLQITSQRR